ncbi:hypothetical protein KFK09_017360 [Dendrobium nobile]|uniref:Ribosome maturation protein SBDS n=1 Tax=Dendrobium nobile TaxID=94219 RepID=A0A8T3B208_DENNO|nr:hypothetical protein KFK09_017360 [Dendrobium nobile]
MSKTLVQPIGQKRLTNVAIVRLKKHGKRFEIACYKNKVLSWRSGVEKDLDEVLQSHTVYSNVSKGILAKSKELYEAFKTTDQSVICKEILEKGELQVAGKERESQLSSQFRDIATIVMQKTINPETQRPYTISMIERLMHEIHFAIDPHNSSKKQALEVIKELQEHFPIKRAPMRLRLIVPERHLSTLMEKLGGWNANVVLKDASDGMPTVVCEIDPGHFRDCDALIRGFQGKLEILSVSVFLEGDSNVYQQYDNTKDAESSSVQETESVVDLGEKIMSNNISTENKSGEEQVKQNKCSTCDTIVGDVKQYREHFKSDWHKHNLRRRTRQLPPLSSEECLAEMELNDVNVDRKDYSF